MLACSAVPVAPPPGVMRLNALPAICVVMMANQFREPKAIACRIHKQAKLAIAHATAGTIHSTWTSPSRDHAAKTSPMRGDSR